ncbi:MAG: response regulator [Ignavibacteria bacterium]|nr:response regulator [Ignavibacteria bacterium]
MVKILLVEDDPFNIELFELVLKRIGNFEVASTDNAKKIFNVLENQKIDLVIMDVSLENTYIDDKKIDGKELSKIIKQKEQFKEIPIIIVTAYATKEDISRILKDSLADACVTKPITNYQDFIALINRHLK